MKAPARDQQRLLSVQAHDTQLHRLAHKRAGLPALAELALVRDQEQIVGGELEIAKAGQGDIRRDLTRLEDEIAKVEARRKRDRERLDSGGGLSRELVSLQQEIESLDRRRDALEENALEVMERAEEAQRAVAGLEASLARLGAEGAAAQTRLDAELGQIGQAEAAEQAARAEAAAGLDEALLALYERLRARLGGVGAAALVARRCEGCGMDLSASDLGAIRVLAEDDVARCEECGRILVRGEDSGL
ncbi:MAG: C4-type zinc ribbon domain-containing protein [Bifidobacteriaceae bacterium]|nr:C4-type zinc ribbon domain-containing protein [Bifidobacteriaceae bacterium]